LSVSFMTVLDDIAQLWSSERGHTTFSVMEHGDLAEMIGR
jgi:hypothetical protein